MIEKTPSKPRQAPDTAGLYAAFVALQNADEAARFFGDIFTPGELATLAERWRVARLLDGGGKTYREIAEETGASTATVTRVARFLLQENNQGYRLILDRLKETSS
jgi:TrpR-related protein YerC/YecD